MARLIPYVRDKKLLYNEDFCADEEKNKARHWCKDCPVFLSLKKKVKPK